MKNEPVCLSCKEPCSTIMEYPAHAGYCQGCHAEALGIGFHSADPEDDDDFDVALTGDLEVYDAGTVYSGGRHDEFAKVFNLFAIVCVAAVLCGLIFQDRPTEGFHGKLTTVGSGPVAIGGSATGPRSEEGK